MSDLPTDPPEEGLLAAEYVLGLLEPEQHVSAQRLAREHPGFAAEVSFWEARLSPLVLEVEAVEPSPRVWERIARALGPAPAATARPAPSARLWESLGFWRGLAGASAAAAASLVLVLTPPTPEPAAPTTPLAVARLQVATGATPFVVSFDPDTRQMIVTPTAGGPRDPEHDHELWLTFPNAPPRSLGVLDQEQPLAIAAPADLMIGATLAVSVEALGGSTSGAPADVVAQGTLTSL
jgi:anti-sigma-K factor RskA